MAAADTPVNIPAAPNPLSAQEERQVVLPKDPWSDDRAYQIAHADYETATRYLGRWHYQRWEQSDRLYLAFRNQKKWDGSNVLRSAIPVFHALSQIESMLANVIGALFSDEFDFMADPRPGTTLEQARAVWYLLRNQLSDLDPERGYLTLRELMRRSFKSANLYGNGILEFGWMLKDMERMVYRRELLPERKQVTDPETGQVALLPTGNYFPRVFQDIERNVISRPFIQNISIKDFFIDPNCPSHMVQDAQYCGVRQLISIRDLEGYRNTPGFQLPSLQELRVLADTKRNTEADNANARTETWRGGQWQPTQDGSADGLSKRVELVRYYNQDRCAWFIPGHGKPLYNKPNDIHSLPFLSTGFTDVPSRFYNLSLCDLVEGDQKLIEEILDARIDELSLMVHAPIVRRKSAVLTGSQRRMRPGVEWEVEGDPAKDIVRMEMGNVTAQAFVEVDQADRRSQKTTGITDLAAIGIPSAGGNSASRTATGVNAQSSASGKRIEYQVINIEEQVIVPLLNVVLAFDQKYLDPEQIVELAGPDGATLQLDPIEVMNASVKFSFRASRRLRARNAMLAGGGLPLILETVFSPQIIPQLAQFGLKPNVAGVGMLVADTFGLPHEQLYLPMSPEEQQAYMMQQQAPDMIRMQMQRERIQGQQDNADDRDETKLIQTFMQALLKHPEIAVSLLSELGFDNAEQMLSKKNEKSALKPPAKKK